MQHTNFLWATRLRYNPGKAWIQVSSTQVAWHVLSVHSNSFQRVQIQTLRGDWYSRSRLSRWAKLVKRSVETLTRKNIPAENSISKWKYLQGCSNFRLHRKWELSETDISLLKNKIIKLYLISKLLVGCNIGLCKVFNPTTLQLPIQGDIQLILRTPGNAERYLCCQERPNNPLQPKREKSWANQHCWYSIKYFSKYRLYLVKFYQAKSNIVWSSGKLIFQLGYK